MRLRVVFAERANCFVGLHRADADAIWQGLGAVPHFCRVLSLKSEATSRNQVYVGHRDGDAAQGTGTIELSQPFAACLGLHDGQTVDVVAYSGTSVASGVMVQPRAVDDFEVVELNAAYIEQHLLQQVAVLMPGGAFPVWIYGQAPVHLQVDSRDENSGPCFLLSIDSELMIETRQRRSIAGKPPEQDPRLLLRVQKQSADLDTPTAVLHPLDLQLILGAEELDSGLCWLQSCCDPPEAPQGDIAAMPPPQLFKATSCDTVPRHHIVLGGCLAESGKIPTFSFVSTWRCRHVPVYVPRIELQPLSPLPRLVSEELWLVRQFSSLVHAVGEIELQSGAILQLRGPSELGGAEQMAATPSMANSGPGGGSGGLLRTLKENSPNETKALEASTEDWPDDFDAIELSEVLCQTAGIVEVDLGLDDAFADEVIWQKDEGTMGVKGSTKQQARCQEVVKVQIRFLLGAHRRGAIAELDMPPYVRITPRLLQDGVAVSVAAAQESLGKSAPPSVAALCAAMPGASAMDMELLLETVSLLGERPTSSNALDHYALFTDAAAELRRLVLAQLGCTSLLHSAGQSEGMTLTVLDALADSSQHPLAVPGLSSVIGGRGSGKSQLCRQVCASFSQDGIMALGIACGKLAQPSKKFQSVQHCLKAIMQMACWHAPSILFFDDMGALFPDVEQGAPNLSVTEERSVLLAEQFMDLLLELRCSGARVALIGSMPSDGAVHRALWRAGVLEHKISMRQPHVKERTQMLQTLCKAKSAEDWYADETLMAEGALDAWTGRVDGYSVADLCALVDRACMEALADAGCLLRASEPRRLCLRHLEEALSGFVPAAMADQSFFTSDVQWADVGGMQAAKEALLGMLTIPTKYGPLVDRAPVRTRRGLMLVGPPGCGKTYLVHAAATETKGLLRFLTVKGPELLSKYIGASEAGVRQVFERAAAAAPSVIFFDEIEALAPKRGGDSTGVTDRVVNQMLTYLDGVDDRGKVYVVAASSRPDLVDAALMRPGRFDKVCYCGLPSAEDKLDICCLLAAKHELKVDTDMEEDLSALAASLPRLFTGADIHALFSSAKIAAINEALESRGASKAPVKPAMTVSHLKSSLLSAKASISPADMAKHEQVFAPYMTGGPKVGAQNHENAPRLRVALA